MLIKIDFSSSTPIYEQLRLQIMEGMARGLLKAGENLPSVRQLAGDLGINLHTVNKAYTQLKTGGFIHVHRQKGVMVNPGVRPGVTNEFITFLEKQLRPLAVEAYCRGMKEEKFCTVAADIFTSLQKPKEK
jgi:GntR family transcriptional regulator